MSAEICSKHNVAMTPVPQDPVSRCTNCHYATHHLRFQDCPECGRKMIIEQPEPHWHCPECVPDRDAQEPAPAAA